MALSLARLLSARPVSEIHVTTQSNVSAIVGKCGARTKVSKVLFVKAGRLTCDALTLYAVELESALLQREAEPEMKRLYPGITMCWASNNYRKRRSEQALLWEGVTLTER